MDVVRADRSKVSPNVSFKSALLQMEYALHGTQSMDEKDFPVPLELGYDDLRLHVVDHGGTERRNSLGERRDSENIESVNLTIDRGNGNHFVSFGGDGETELNNSGGSASGDGSGTLDGETVNNSSSSGNSSSYTSSLRSNRSWQ